MYYYNEKEIPNHKEIKINYLNNNKKKFIHRSTDNIFGTYRGYTLHTIYNNFLVNPYLVRNKRYQNAINENYEKNQTLNNKNRYMYNKNVNNVIEKNNINSIRNEYSNDNNNIKINNNNMSAIYEYNNSQENFKLPMINTNQNQVKNKIYVRKNILDEESKNKSFYENNYQKVKKTFQYKINREYNKNQKKYSYDHMNIERPIEYNIKTQKEFNDSFYTNNIDKMNISYDKRKKNYLNRNIEYISPVEAKIAKHNYLMKNPYTDKNEYLGPSKLRHNPILYPISTYKFDFNRYIRNYPINKLF